MNQFLRYDIYKEAQKFIERDQKFLEELQSELRLLEDEVRYISREGLKELKMFFIDILGISAWKFMDIVSHIKTIKPLLQGGMAFAAADSGLNVFKALSSAGSGASSIVQGALGLLFLPLNIFSLVRSSIELNQGNVTKQRRSYEISLEI